MGWLKQNRVWVVAAIGVAAIVWLVALSQPFQECICAQQNAEAEKTFYKNIAHILTALGVLRGCTGYFVHESGEAITAFATLLIGVFTWTLWRSTDRAGEHFQITERAYVRMSHVSDDRDGLQWDEEPDSGGFDVRIEVKNCGKTPARVTAVFLDHEPVPSGKEFPVDFSYRDSRLSYDAGKGYTFLMPTDSFYITYDGAVMESERAAVDRGAKFGTLIVFGYVDYIDQFGNHHRAGYGRQYIPGEAGNNLGFPNVRARLNYDEIRSPRVGWDWHQ